MDKKLQVIEELHASFYTVTREELKKYDFIKGDLEGLVNVPLTIKGHKLSISLREDTDIDNRISVVSVCRRFPMQQDGSRVLQWWRSSQCFRRQIAVQHAGGRTDSTESNPGIRRYAEVAVFSLRNDEKDRKQPRFEAIG